jgi:DNA-binding MarR family transcriptional regulator
VRSDVVQLIDEVRLLEHVLVRAAEVLHSSTGVSVAGRAVLEFVERHGPTPVPDIARARHVTRQHIQVIVDALTEQGLVSRAPNPGHRSSPLITLTRVGARTIDSIHNREHRLLDRRMAAIAERDVRAATVVLAAVRAELLDMEAS